MERVEAGIVLTGTEVKSLRGGKANLEDAYAEVTRRRDLVDRLRHPRVSPGQPDEPRSQTTAQTLAPSPRDHKLDNKTGEKGMTIVPLSIYFKKGMAKVELSTARGRKTYDKREALKKQDAKREIDRALRRR